MKTHTQNITNIYGQKGKNWISNLPTIITVLAKHWNLSHVIPVDNMTFNYVAKATLGDKQPVILKVSCDLQTILDERRALIQFEGNGSVKLIDTNDKYNALLLRQAVPGTTRYCHFPLKELYPEQVEYIMDCYVGVINKLHEKHLSSTAIPGIAAKPIVDIQIAAHSLDEMKVIAIPVLQKLGYEYWYENPDAERMFFVKGMPPFGEKRTHHVHIVEPTSKHWSGKINFRDYLIAHPVVAKEYQDLKIKLAKQHTYDRKEYTNAKGEFVNKILKLAQNESK